MTAQHEAEVGTRFDQLHRRFQRVVAADDVRLGALRECLGPLGGRRVLDLGCGKGRFAARLEEAGAGVIGIDLSAAMLAEARGLPRVRGSARRLPFAASSFDAVIAVELFEHLHRAALDEVLEQVRRVLRAGGILAIVDKNAGSMNAQRPWLPNLAVKWIDQKRGRWMYPSGGPVRERWFWPGRLKARLLRSGFEDVRMRHLLLPSEAGSRLFRHVSCSRLMVLWSARVPGGPVA